MAMKSVLYCCNILGNNVLWHVGAVPGGWCQSQQLFTTRRAIPFDELPGAGARYEWSRWSGSRRIDLQTAASALPAAF